MRLRSLECSQNLVMSIRHTSYLHGGSSRDSNFVARDDIVRFSLGIVSFNTMEEAVNAMTTVNLRMSSGDDRVRSRPHCVGTEPLLFVFCKVPIHWLASGVHVELDSPVQDE